MRYFNRVVSGFSTGLGIVSLFLFSLLASADVVATDFSAKGADVRASAPVRQQQAQEPKRPEASLQAISYWNLPLTFEPNLGQTDGRVRFLSRTAGSTVFFTPAETVFVFSGHEKNEVVRLRLVGANAAPSITGVDRLSGVSNYFRGSDRSKWITRVPNFARVRYESVYRGIDLVYYGNQQQLEFDFVVAPGIDPKKIRLAIDGAKKLKIEKSGDLLMTTRSGELRMRKPLLYQEIEGVRKEIAGSFALQRNQVTFEIAKYDTAKPLLIDPVLNYSTYLSNSAAVSAAGVAVDSAKNAYVTGNTTVAGFPGSATECLTCGSGGGADVYVAKIDSTGTALVYNTFIGGSGADSSAAIAIDGSGNAYLTGSTQSSDFPVSAGGALGGTQDAFIAKLNASGTALLFSSYVGGNVVESGNGIAVSGAVAYVTGATDSANFPLSANAFDSAVNGTDAFLYAVDTSTGATLYGSFLGGSAADSGNAIAVNAMGVFVTGSTQSADFPTASPSGFAADTSYNDAGDAFVARFDVSHTLSYATFLGGSGLDEGLGIAADNAGNAFVTGSTTSVEESGVCDPWGDPPCNAFPIVNPTDSFANGGSDAFVTKVNPEGDFFLFSTFLGGSGDDAGKAIAVDASGIYIAGFTQSVSGPAAFPTTTGTLQSSGGGTQDAFVTKIQPLTSGYEYSTFLGGSGNDDSANGIAVDAQGAAYIAGQGSSTDFPVTASAFQTLSVSSGAAPSAFVAKLAGNGNNARLAIVGTGDPETVESANTDVTYTYTVTNTTSSGTATRVTFNAPIPGGALAPQLAISNSPSPSVTTGTGTCTVGAGGVTCDLTSIGAGTSKTVTIVAQPTPAAGQTISNVVSVAAAEAGSFAATEVTTNVLSGGGGDTVAPSISGQVMTAPNAASWNNSSVTVRFTCSDAQSGVSLINASGAASGTSTSSPLDVVIDAQGTNLSLTGTCFDVAGNSADATVSGINIDKTKPEITGSRSPSANVDGWNNTDVSVSFACQDSGAVQSGIATNTLSGAVLSAEGRNQSVTNSGACVDAAGNSADPVTVSGINIDKTQPSAPTLSVSPAPNAAGWNNADVTVSFAENGDVGAVQSGIAACTSSASVTAETAGTTVSGACTDKAGNISAAVSATIKLDKTVPVVAVTGVTNGASYVRGSVPAAACSTSDALSGVAVNAVVNVTGGTADGTGTFTATCSGGRDVAGNVAPPVSVMYNVVAAGYRFIGFLPPLSSGSFSGAFELSRPISVRWQLINGSGSFVNALSAVRSLQVAANLNCVVGNHTAPFALSRSSLRYDTANNQYVYDWQTRGLPRGCYTLILTLDDGSVHSTMVRLEAPGKIKPKERPRNR